LAFVPITPAGMGVQEFGIVGIIGLLVTSPLLGGTIAAFALLARGLLVVEDLAGVPQIVRSTSSLFPSKKTAETPPTISVSEQPASTS
jgi:hypothetical protein